MLETIVYRWRLALLQRNKRKARRRLEARIEEAKAAHDPDAEQSLIADWFDETDLADDEIALLQSQYLQATADRLLLAVPGLEDKTTWTKSSVHPNRVYLSKEGVQAIRAQIREEKRFRREAREALLPWLAALTGLIGALTGFTAVMWH